MTSRRKRMKHAQWREHLDAQKQSGLSVKEYCQAHNLGPASFQYHRSRMRQASAPSASVTGFTEIRPRESGLKLYSPEGSWVLELDAGFDVGTLQRFLSAVGR
ncbi:MAG: hypothetical protein JJU05_04605 [Verrucomicrobia bacterium]|nr:hypothetical protein [Verrucomicrobiota bacterium]MCH8529167.1 hypothetical protein [Kiritimatiellia bacterium]